MKIENLKVFENKTVRVILRNNRTLDGKLTIENNVILIRDRKSHAVLLIPQEITQIEEIENAESTN